MLVAISIPIFSSQLEKSRDAVTLSNVRAAYAEAQSAYLTQSNDGANVTYTAANASGSAASVAVSHVKAEGRQSGLDNSGNLPFASANGFSTAMSTLGEGKGDQYTLTFTYNDSGSLSDFSVSKE